MTREQAVRWCQERGYCFVELDRDEIVYTEKMNIRRWEIGTDTPAHAIYLQDTIGEMEKELIANGFGPLVLGGSSTPPA